MYDEEATSFYYGKATSPHDGEAISSHDGSGSIPMIHLYIPDRQISRSPSLIFRPRPPGPGRGPTASEINEIDQRALSFGPLVGRGQRTDPVWLVRRRRGEPIYRDGRDGWTKSGS